MPTYKVVEKKKKSFISGRLTGSRPADPPSEVGAREKPGFVYRQFFSKRPYLR